MPAVNGVGEPCAGKPHARFEAAGAGNGAPWPRSRQWDTRTGNHRNHKAAGPTANLGHRASSRPYNLGVGMPPPFPIPHDVRQWLTDTFRGCNEEVANILTSVPTTHEE